LNLFVTHGFDWIESGGFARWVDSVDLRELAQRIMHPNVTASGHDPPQAEFAVSGAASDYISVAVHSALCLAEFGPLVVNRSETACGHKIKVNEPIHWSLSPYDCPRAVNVCPFAAKQPLYLLQFGCVSAVIPDLICFFTYAPDPCDD
jgi:hypothetical protein